MPEIRTILLDLTAASLLSGTLLLFPGGAFSAGGANNGGPGNDLSSETDGEPVECHCEKKDDSGEASWTLSCVNSAGVSIGGIPLGAVGYAGSALTQLFDLWGNYEVKEWAIDNRQDPDYWGTNEGDGFGLWDSLQVQCDGSYVKTWEVLKGDCDENPPSCAPSTNTSNYTCEVCPPGYEWPTPVTTPW